MAEKTETREALAAYAHEAWAGWMRYLFEKSTKNDDGTVTIPGWAVERWERQSSTPYENLPEDEKQSDRVEADRMISIIESSVVNPHVSRPTYETANV